NESNGKYRAIYEQTLMLDSLQKSGASDSLLQVRGSERASLVQQMKQYVENIVRNAKSPSFAMYALGNFQSVAGNLRMTGFTSEELVALVNGVAARFPEHTGLASIKNTLAQQQAQVQQQQAQQAASLVGRPAPDFALPDVNGKPVPLSSFRGKYVLVDFWASWCPPCRAENPNVVRAFNQYKNKNFTILGVSLDRPGQKDAWMKAIQDDGLAWTHVSDLKFWESAVVPLYNIEGIPYNVLVDPAGTVVAENLREEALHAKLQEVLK
ncbi:MAG TPA: TlpA disulfide reductase family protein, partial [Chitinophagaceae bacterium]|nr:TlpA disulfide reductase family protein [Chitinophagaceae bacterium]